MLQDTKSHSLAGFLTARLQPRLPRPRPGDLQDGQALAERQAAQRPRRGRRGALQGHPDDQDHGAAVELPVAHRREGDPPRPLQADQGRVLHGGHPADGGVPRQSLRDRGGPRLRQGTGSGGRRPRTRRAAPLAEGEERGGRRGAGARHPLREPRPAPLPAVGVRDLQGGARDGLAELRHHPVPGRPRRPGRWWCSSTWPRSGCRSPASPRRRSPTTTRSGRRSSSRCRSAGAGSACSSAAASGPRPSSGAATSSSSTSRRSSRRAPG